MIFITPGLNVYLDPFHPDQNIRLAMFILQKGIPMKKRILYGVANYEEIIAENGYFVDKTRYIPELEMILSLIHI